MAFCYLLAWLIIEPTQEIHLDFAGLDSTGVKLQRLGFAADGSFLGVGAHSVWHWDRQGRYLGHFGGRGEGPGEFVYISDALWDGTHYWVIDGGRQVSSVFDSRGRFLFHQSLYFRQLIQCENQLFALNLEGLRPDILDYPPVVLPITYQITDRELLVDAVGPAFRKITPRQRDFRLNFKLVWVVGEELRFLVVDQLEPKISVYTAGTREVEQRTPLLQSFTPPSIPMQLTNWVEPPAGLAKNQMSPEESRRWWYSFSRINFFGRTADGKYYVVAYESPDPDDPMSGIQWIQVLGLDGKKAGTPFEAMGSIVGLRNQTIAVYFPDEHPTETLHKVVLLDL